MIKPITRNDILISVKRQLDRQRIIEKDGFLGLMIHKAKMFDNAANNDKLTKPYSVTCEYKKDDTIL